MLGLGEAGPAPPSVGPRPRLSAAASPCCILKSSEVVLQLCPSLSKFPPAVPDVFAFPSAPDAELATLCGGLLGSPLGLCTGPLAQGERSRVSGRTALRLRTRPAVSPLGRVPPCARQRCVSLWLCASVTRNRSCCGPGGLPGPLYPGPVGAHPGARAAGRGGNRAAPCRTLLTCDHPPPGGRGAGARRALTPGRGDSGLPRLRGRRVDPWRGVAWRCRDPALPAGPASAARALAARPADTPWGTQAGARGDRPGATPPAG